MLNEYKSISTNVIGLNATVSFRIAIELEVIKTRLKSQKCLSWVWRRECKIPNEFSTIRVALKL